MIGLRSRAEILQLIECGLLNFDDTIGTILKFDLKNIDISNYGDNVWKIWRDILKYYQN